MQVDLRDDIKLSKEEEARLRKLGLLGKEPVPYDEEKMMAALAIPAVKQVRVFAMPDARKAKKERREKRKAQRKARKKNR